VIDLLPPDKTGRFAMSESVVRQRAAAYVYLHDARAGAHALLFGRCGTDPTIIDYRVTISADGGATRRLRLRVRGDFTGLLESGVLRNLGKRPLSVRLRLNDKPVAVDFEPDAMNSANALIRTSTGFSGTIIEIQSSELVAVAVCVVALMCAVTWDVVAVGAEIAINTQASSDDGSADVDIHADGHDDEGGDGGGNGDPQ
jgi:hypothetical protein